MKIVAISDFHGILPQDLPKCDIILIAGDISPFKIQGMKSFMNEWINIEFKEWVKNQQCSKIIMTPGNHKK